MVLGPTCTQDAVGSFKKYRCPRCTPAMVLVWSGRWDLPTPLQGRAAGAEDPWAGSPPGPFQLGRKNLCSGQASAKGTCRLPSLALRRVHFQLLYK